MQYNELMKKCIKLAQKGYGEVSPNPLVGAVVLDKDGIEIASGYHAKCGENHAERDALIGLNDEARGGTLIVNLEPCSHYGKTPPCTDIIIEKGIARVVVGMRDPNPNIDGISILRKAGVEVVEGILEDECKQLNEVFIKNKIEGKTFVALKTATTLDGKIATSTGSSKWITSDEARARGKELRAQYDAILTSSATVLADDPTMEHKTKIILDRNSRLTGKEKIFQQGEVHVFKEDNIEFILKKLYEMGIMSIFVEAGGKLSGEMLPYVDKIYHFIAPKITGDNSAKSCFDFRKITDINESLNFKIMSTELVGDDLLIINESQ